MENLQNNMVKKSVWKRALIAYLNFCDLQARSRDQY